METISKTLVIVLLLTTGLSLDAQMAMSHPLLDVESSSIEVLETDFTAPRTDLLRTETRDFVFGPATRIKFKIIEDESGLETTFFKIANFPFMKSDGRQMMPHDLKDGDYLMKYYSVDKEGNQEQIRMDKIYLDKKGPEVTSSFNVSPISFEDGIPVFPKDVELIINVSDKKVEVQKVIYTINDGPKIESEDLNQIDLSEELKNIEEETVIVKVTAYDVFYNMSKEVIEFKISR